ncbi:hypothetical protein E2542_SST10574 [Spatholobus suberectus]|nr:hypothetical protein E2542_SST10574 [Spatholobus suberectus]
MSIIFEGERVIPKGQFPSGAMATAEEGNSNTETVRSSEPCNLPTQVIDGTLDSDSIIRINDVLTKKHKFINPSESIRKKRTHLKIGETLEHTLYEVFTAAKSKAKQRNASNSTTMYKNCLEELQKLEELDDNEFAKAVNALKDDKNAIAFMTIKGPRRLTWLRRILDTPSHDLSAKSLACFFKPYFVEIIFPYTVSHIARVVQCLGTRHTKLNDMGSNTE